MTRSERIELAARELLAVMDSQHGQPVFSLNVSQARMKLRQLLPSHRDERDRSRERGEAA